MLNEKIKSLRISYNMTQVGLAKALGVSKQCVSNWENDNVQPSVDMLIKIARYFKVTTDYLLDFGSGKVIDAEGLTDEEIAHIRLIIADLTAARKH